MRLSFALPVVPPSLDLSLKPRPHSCASVLHANCAWRAKIICACSFFHLNFVRDWFLGLVLIDDAWSCPCRSQLSVSHNTHCVTCYSWNNSPSSVASIERMLSFFKSCFIFLKGHPFSTSHFPPKLTPRSFSCSCGLWDTQADAQAHITFSYFKWQHTLTNGTRHNAQRLELRKGAINTRK